MDKQFLLDAFSLRKKSERYHKDYDIWDISAWRNSDRKDCSMKKVQENMDFFLISILNIHETLEYIAQWEGGIEGVW